MGILDACRRIEALTYGASPSTSQSHPPPTSSSRGGGGGRFAKAVVSNPSTDFIRAANPAQAAVYTIKSLNTDKPGQLEKAEIRTKMVAIATPLRKAKGARRSEATGEGRKPRKSKVAALFTAENDPEVPLRAALKLVDMYPSAMPSELREQILAKLEAAQAQTSRLTELARPKHQIRDDDGNETERLKRLEEEIRTLEEEYAQEKRRVDDFMKARAAQMFAEADESMDSEGSPTAKRAARQQGKLKGKSTAMEADETTDFANLNLGDNSLLMEADTPDISQLMAQTPLKPSTSKAISGGRTQQKPSLATLAQRAREVGLGNVQPRTPPRRTHEDSFEDTPRAGYTFEVPDPIDQSVEQEEEQQPDDTVVLRSEERVVEKEEEVEDIPKEEPAAEEMEAPPSPPPSKETPAAREDDLVVSMDFARMRSFSIKIWTIAGDVLIPGNQFDVGKGSGTDPVPNYPQTKKLLQKIISEAPSSPDASNDIIIQVLTAKLLLHIISRDSTSVENSADAFSAGMNEAKELLNEILDANQWKREHGNKVIFMWVGKKLLKSEGGRKLRCNLD
ncbi:hypothetical protein CPB86DRAFT_812391 [Serendipita vermifera]|nr:hypothetical protein CPB86DRAFT_812391 [Serendipita vermifera]